MNKSERNQGILALQNNKEIKKEEGFSHLRGELWSLLNESKEIGIQIGRANALTNLENLIRRAVEMARETTIYGGEEDSELKYKLADEILAELLKEITE